MHLATRRPCEVLKNKQQNTSVIQTKYNLRSQSIPWETFETLNTKTTMNLILYKHCVYSQHMSHVFHFKIQISGHFFNSSFLHEVLEAVSFILRPAETMAFLFSLLRADIGHSQISQLSITTHIKCIALKEHSAEKMLGMI